MINTLGNALNAMTSRWCHVRLTQFFGSCAASVNPHSPWFTPFQFAYALGLQSNSSRVVKRAYFRMDMVRTSYMDMVAGMSTRKLRFTIFAACIIMGPICQWDIPFSPTFLPSHVRCGPPEVFFPPHEITRNCHIGCTPKANPETAYMMIGRLNADGAS